MPCNGRFHAGAEKIFNGDRKLHKMQEFALNAIIPYVEWRTLGLLLALIHVACRPTLHHIDAHGMETVQETKDVMFLFMHTYGSKPGDKVSEGEGT